MRAIYILVLFVIAFAATAFFTLPLSFVLKQASLSRYGATYGHVEGPVWNGRIHNLIIASQPIGRVDVKTNPISLIGMAPRTDWSFQGAAGSGRGEATIRSNRSITLRNTIVDLNVQALSRLDPRLRQAPSTLSVTLRELKMDEGGRCHAASGALSTDILSSLGGRYAWEGPSMLGEIRCDGGAYLVSLRNDGGEDAIQASIRIEPTGLFDVSAQMNTANNNVKAALPVLGFEERDGVYHYLYTNRVAPAPNEGDT